MTEFLACGHTANARDSEGKPSCVICVGIDPGAKTVVTSPSLGGRKAACHSVHNKDHTTSLMEPAVDSNLELAFFEYTGPGSRAATEICVCHFHRKAHETMKSENFDHKFTPHGAWEYDSYYCGHGGWD